MSSVTVIENIHDQDSWKTHLDITDVPKWLYGQYKANWPTGAKLFFHDLNNDVTPTTSAEIAALERMDGDFYLTEQPLGPLAAVLIGGALLAFKVISALTAEDPSKVPKRRAGGPNNRLADRSNAYRPNERIPDIYGQVRSTPDLIAVPHTVYENHIQVEYAYMCIGRGEFEIDEDSIQDDTTPIIQITGTSIEIYKPLTSPQTGSFPQLRVGTAIQEKLISSKRSVAVDGQSLRAPNADSFRGRNDITFVYPDTIQLETQSENSFGEYFFEDDKLIVTNASYTGAIEGGGNQSVDMSGTYDVLAVDDKVITLANPNSVNSDWDALDNFAAPQENQTGFLSSTLATTTEKFVGPFDLKINGLNGVICNFLASAGLFKVRPATEDKAEKQIALDIQILVEVTALDTDGNVIGDPLTTSSVISGSQRLRTQRALTIRFRPIFPKETLDNPLFTGWVQVRTKRVTEKNLEFNGEQTDQIDWVDLFGFTDVPNNLHFGNVTTLYAVTRASAAAQSIEDRKLNLIVSRKVKQDGDGIFAASRKMKDILAALCLDSHIGRRNLDELDINQWNQVQVDIENYFNEPVAGEFNGTFDDNNLSFEEIAIDVTRAAFCIPYRTGSTIKIKFEKEGNQNRLLFNHRNKLPGSENRTVRFGPKDGFDSVELEYFDPQDDAIITFYVPEDQSGVNPDTLDFPGIRGKTHAYLHAYRQFNKNNYENTIVEFRCTTEAAMLLINDRVLVADNTNADTIDGQVRFVNGLTLTLSQRVPTRLVGYSIFLQLYDATIDSIAVVNGPTEYEVVLARNPRLSLVIDPKRYAVTTYQLVQGTKATPKDFLVRDKQFDGATLTLEVSNYDTRFYQNDKDFIALDPGTGAPAPPQTPPPLQEELAVFRINDFQWTADPNYLITVLDDTITVESDKLEVITCRGISRNTQFNSKDGQWFVVFVRQAGAVVPDVIIDNLLVKGLNITFVRPIVVYTTTIYVSPDVSVGLGSGTEVDPKNITDSINTLVDNTKIIVLQGTQAYNVGNFSISESGILIMAQPGEFPVFIGSVLAPDTWTSALDGGFTVWTLGSGFDDRMNILHVKLGGEAEYNRLPPKVDIASMKTAGLGWSIVAGELKVILPTSDDMNLIDVWIAKDFEEFAIFSGDNITIEGIQFEMYGARGANAGGNTSTEAIVFNNASNIEITGCIFKDIGSRSIYYFTIEGYYCSNNQFINSVDKWCSLADLTITENPGGSGETFTYRESNAILCADSRYGKFVHNLFSQSIESITFISTFENGGSPGIPNEYIDIAYNHSSKQYDEAFDLNEYVKHIRIWENTANEFFQQGLSTFGPGPVIFINNSSINGAYLPVANRRQYVSGDDYKDFNVFNFRGPGNNDLPMFVIQHNTWQWNPSNTYFNRADGFKATDNEFFANLIFENNILDGIGRVIRTIPPAHDTSTEDWNGNIYYSRRDYSTFTGAFFWNNNLQDDFADYQSETAASGLGGTPHDEDSMYGDPFIDSMGHQLIGFDGINLGDMSDWGVGSAQAGYQGEGFPLESLNLVSLNEYQWTAEVNGYLITVLPNSITVEADGVYDLTYNGINRSTEKNYKVDGNFFAVFIRDSEQPVSDLVLDGIIVPGQSITPVRPIITYTTTVHVSPDVNPGFGSGTDIDPANIDDTIDALVDSTKIILQEGTKDYNTGNFDKNQNDLLFEAKAGENPVFNGSVKAPHTWTSAAAGGDTVWTLEAADVDNSMSLFLVEFAVGIPIRLPPRTGLVSAQANGFGWWLDAGELKVILPTGADLNVIESWIPKDYEEFGVFGGDNVTFDGLEFKFYGTRNANPGGNSRPSGLNFTTCSNSEVKNCIFNDIEDRGIYFFQVIGWYSTNNTFKTSCDLYHGYLDMKVTENPGGTGELVHYEGSSSLLFVETQFGTIQENSFTEQMDSIVFVTENSYVDLVDCDFLKLPAGEGLALSDRLKHIHVWNNLFDETHYLGLATVNGDGPVMFINNRFLNGGYLAPVNQVPTAENDSYKNYSFTKFNSGGPDDICPIIFQHNTFQYDPNSSFFKRIDGYGTGGTEFFTFVRFENNIIDGAGRLIFTVAGAHASSTEFWNGNIFFSRSDNFYNYKFLWDSDEYITFADYQVGTIVSSYEGTPHDENSMYGDPLIDGLGQQTIAFDGIDLGDMSDWGVSSQESGYQTPPT